MNYSETDIANWKKKFGNDNLRLLTITSQKDIEIDFVLRMPDRIDTAAFTELVPKNVDVAMETLVKSCVLWSSVTIEEALNEADVFLALSKNLQQLIQVKAEVIKKL